jgi:predicted metal-dependent hydrolase
MTPPTDPSPNNRTTEIPPVRRVDFGHAQGEDPLPKYFMNGDPVMSHFMAVFSSLFPEGEQFFVRSVRAYRDQITDPVLRRQVTGFIGQEAIHSREHEEFNERLRRLGYRTDLVERLVGWSLGLSERLPGRSRRLATTAALEHYTSTLAGVLLVDAEARALFSSDEVRNLFLWHALEETEHKAVAFDVLAEVSGDERLRRIIMTTTTIGFLSMAFGCTTLSLLTDPGTWRRPNRVLRGLGALRRSPWLNGRVVRELRDYQRVGFHPNDYDTAELVEQWRAALFGDSDQAAPPAAAAG